MSDRPRVPGEIWLAPPAAASAQVARFPARHDDLPLPAVDDHIVEPETRWEMLDGELIYAVPAEEPHAATHSQLDFVVRGLAAPGYKTASDMLTRTGHRSNFAPDASIYPEERHPVTKGHKLEELAFEVVSEQSLQVPTTKARQLVDHGVRRVFTVLVGKQKILEWSRQAGDWVELAGDAEIVDRCLVRPQHGSRVSGISPILEDQPVTRVLYLAKVTDVPRDNRHTMTQRDRGNDKVGQIDSAPRSIEVAANATCELRRGRVERQHLAAAE